MLKGAESKLHGPARLGHFRAFLARPTTRYRSRGAVPASLLPTLEGHDTAEGEYETLLRTQVLGLFDSLEDIAVPANPQARPEELAALDKKATLARSSKSVARRGQMNVWKEIAAEEEAREKAAVSAAAMAPSGRSLRELMVSFDTSMEVAEALLCVEDLNWAGLFHLRYLFTQRLMKRSTFDHIRSVVEVFLAQVSNNDETYGQCRKLASKLMQYLVSHLHDPDNALMGMSPSTKIAARLRNHLTEIYGDDASRPELRDKVIGFDKADKPSLLAAPMAHGALVIANLSGIGMRFVRFSRIDPVR